MSKRKKTDQDRDVEISAYRAEMDLDSPTVQDGRPHGVVVSVRLDAEEAERLRGLAASLDLNMSQVLRRALNAFEPGEAGTFRLLVRTQGAPDWPTTVAFQGSSGERREMKDEPESSTLGARIWGRIPA
jgi:hypothetical protein